MNENKGHREKGRAVFLAAIMMLSMVAGVATFAAAPAAAQNTGDVSFDEQATISSTIVDDRGDTPAVLVGLDVGQDSTVVVTYEDGNDLVVAGLENVDEEADEAVVEIDDADGFPGEHVAHVIPEDGVSDNTENMSVVSDEIADNIIDNESADVFLAELEFEDQEFAAGGLDEGDTVTVSTADLLPEGSDELFTVDVHPTDDDGNLIGNSFIGSSDVLETGNNSNVDVEIETVGPNAPELPIRGEDTFVAMIHLVDDGGADPGDDASPGDFPVLPHTDSGGAIPGGVTDSAVLTEEPVDQDFVDAPPAIASAGSEVSTEVDITNPGPENLTDLEVEFNIRDDADAEADLRQALDAATIDELNVSETVTVELAGAIDENEFVGAPEDVGIGVETSENPTTSTYQELTVTDPADDGFITGDLRDAVGDRIDDAGEIPIRVFAEGEEIEASPIFVEEPDDDYTQRVPIDGTETEYTVEIDPDEAEEATGIPFESFARTVDVEQGATERIDIRLERLVVPDELDVAQDADSAFADGEDEITFTVDVTGDDGEPFEGAEVEITHDGEDGSIFFDGTPQDSFTGVTDEDGEFEVAVASNTVQSVEFTFVEQEEGLTEFATKNFVLDGEGTISGEVLSKADDERSIQDAQVHTFPKEDFTANSIGVPVPDAGETQFYRVVDTETGEILDASNDYRVDNDGQTDALNLITTITQLNTTDAAVGSGFAVEADAAAGPVFVTPLEPGEYVIEVSDTAPLASDDRLSDADNPSEDFAPLVTEAEAPNNLTFEAAQEFSDGPGDQITFDTTESEGQFILQNLFTDFQSGVDYTVVATAPGFDTQFTDPVVTEDGLFFEGQPLEQLDFELDPVPITPDDVEIENVGLEEDGEIEEFDNKTDEFAQEIPRDGSVDVINVTTTGEGALVNTTVELTVPDDAGQSLDTDASVNFTGEFVDVVGGEFVEDEGEQTAVIHTGDETDELDVGEAQVFLQTDEAPVDLDRVDQTDQSGDFEPPSNETGIFAQLEADRSATDFTEKRFVGVVEFQAGSVSGLVTNEDDEPIPQSLVFVEEFEFADEAGSNAFEIEPVDDVEDIADTGDAGELEFEITDVDENESAIVTGAELEDYDFADFPRIDIGEDVQGGTFDLFVFPGDDARYTLGQVPAVEQGIDYQVSGIQFETGDIGTGASSASVEPGLTTEANIVIVGVDPLNPATFDITGVEPGQDLEASPGDELEIEVDVENSGDFDDEQDVEFVLDGDVVDDVTETLALDAGEEGSVTLDVVVPDVEEETTFEWFIQTDDDESVTLDLTVTPNAPNADDVVAFYDEDGDGQIGDTEVLAGVQDWQDGEGFFADLDEDAADQAILELVQTWQDTS